MTTLKLVTQSGGEVVLSFIPGAVETCPTCHHTEQNHEADSLVFQQEGKCQTLVGPIARAVFESIEPRRLPSRDFGAGGGISSGAKPL